RRFSDFSNFTSLDPYYLGDLRIKYDYAFRKVNGGIVLAIKNITNTEYESIALFPIPGIHYNLKSFIKF
ncbi:MAG: hypothetical protein AAGK97_15550, partial [Bacteroidota bacterium]